MTVIIPDEVADDERLARCCFSSKSKNHRLFKTSKEHKNEISVDRSSLAGDAITLTLAVDRLKERIKHGTAKTFHGWRILLKRDAAVDGRDVVGARVDGNPYHANIELLDLSPPPPPYEDPYVFHAQKLADASHWKPAPSYEHLLQLAT